MLYHLLSQVLTTHRQDVHAARFGPSEAKARLPIAQAFLERSQEALDHLPDANRLGDTNPPTPRDDQPYAFLTMCANLAASHAITLFSIYQYRLFLLKASDSSSPEKLERDSQTEWANAADAVLDILRRCVLADVCIAVD